MVIGAILSAYCGRPNQLSTSVIFTSLPVEAAGADVVAAAVGADVVAAAAGAAVVATSAGAEVVAAAAGAAVVGLAEDAVEPVADV